MHVDILYNILQKKNTDPVRTSKALDNFSSSISALKHSLALATDDAQGEPGPEANAAGAARRRRGQPTDNVTVAKQCCDIMTEQSKVRYSKAQHLISFELIDANSHHNPHGKCREREVFQHIEEDQIVSQKHNGTG